MRLSTIWIAIVLSVCLWIVIGWSIYDLSKSINNHYGQKIEYLNKILEREGVK